MESNDRKNLLAVNLALVCNLLLAAVKTSVGILGHSPALLADGIMSTSDVVYLVIMRIFMAWAGQPPDREHPYGHRQLEGVAAVIVGAFVLTTGVAIFWNAVNDIYDLATGQSQFEGALLVTLWVALFALVAKVSLAVFTQRVGQATRSIAVLALARDHRTDVLSIGAVVLGIYLSRSGLPWGDPLAAAIVGVFIFKTGIQILRESSASLLDILPDASVNARIRQLVEAVPGVDQLEEVHSHRLGIYLLVNVIIGVDGSLSVAEGDKIALRVENTLRSEIKYLRQVSVHFHPSRAPLPIA